MKYKVGDQVRVRQWQALKRESLALSKRMVFDDVSFMPDMKQACGEAVTIRAISGKGYSITPFFEDYIFTDGMFEGPAFEYGELIEVSDTITPECPWYLKHYLGYIDGHSSPYAVAEPADYPSASKFYSCRYKFARKLQPVAQPTCQGKVVEIDGKKYKLQEV